MNPCPDINRLRGCLRLLGRNIGGNGLISRCSGVISSCVISSPQRGCSCTGVMDGAQWDGYIILAGLAEDQGPNATSCHHSCGPSGPRQMLQTDVQLHAPKQ